MGAAGTFTITELGRVGGRSGGRPDGGEGEIFEWTNDTSPQDPIKGGGRCIPRQPWVQGGMLRTVRTDYPGAKTPSEQVLGPNHKPQSFSGNWDDRYNFPTFARGELRRFEAMARRGNLVRIAFQEMSYEALITDWNFTYKRDWQIGYSFTASIHDRADDYSLADRSPDTTLSATEAFSLVDLSVSGLSVVADENLRKLNLEGKLAGDAANASKVAMADILVKRDALGDTLDQQELSISDLANRVASPFRRVATEFRAISASANSALDIGTELRSDINLGVNTVMGVLQFEDWSRTLRFQQRILMGQATVGANEMDERAEPDAVRVYRPSQGESLYQISRRFYGTPHSWRLIADRNGLVDFELTGEELLIIPESGVS